MIWHGQPCEWTPHLRLLYVEQSLFDPLTSLDEEAKDILTHSSELDKLASSGDSRYAAAAAFMFKLAYETNRPVMKYLPLETVKTRAPWIYARMCQQRTCDAVNETIAECHMFIPSTTPRCNLTKAIVNDDVDALKNTSTTNVPLKVLLASSNCYAGHQFENIPQTGAVAYHMYVDPLPYAILHGSEKCIEYMIYNMRIEQPANSARMWCIGNGWNSHFFERSIDGMDKDSLKKLVCDAIVMRRNSIVMQILSSALHIDYRYDEDIEKAAITSGNLRAIESIYHARYDYDEEGRNCPVDLSRVLRYAVRRMLLPVLVIDHGISGFPKELLTYTKSKDVQKPFFFYMTPESRAIIYPLFDACARGDAEYVVSALKSSPALVHASDEKNRGCLYYAAKHNQTDIVRILLAYGASISKRKTCSDETPFTVAAKHNCYEVVELMLIRRDFSIHACCPSYVVFMENLRRTNKHRIYDRIIDFK